MRFVDFDGVGFYHFFLEAERFDSYILVRIRSPSFCYYLRPQIILLDHYIPLHRNQIFQIVPIPIFCFNGTHKINILILTFIDTLFDDLDAD